MARPTNKEVKLRDALAVEETISYIVATRPLMGFTRDDIKDIIRKFKSDLSAGIVDPQEVLNQEKLRYLIFQNRRSLGFNDQQIKTMMDKAFAEINGADEATAVAATEAIGGETAETK